ncbi:MAG: hypothetical protein ABEJ66_02380, partial [Candidatus Nanohaloarchaea archaeon]
YLYVADSDPQVAGTDSNTDYDSVWVDNGTRCQFSSSEGPYYQEEFFRWGNTSDSEPDMYYDLENITSSGKLVLYQADQPVRFRNVLKGEVNGIETSVTVDTFNFSTAELGGYGTIVFRQDESLSYIGNRQERMMDYIEENAALFLMNLSENDLDSGFMDRTGLRWKGLETTSPISGVRFTDTGGSGRVENLFLGQSGSRSSVTLLPGGTIDSRETRLVLAQNGRYRTDMWNATNMSMEEVDNPPPGVAESDCGNYTYGTFEFPSKDLEAWGSELGNPSAGTCTDSQEIWGVSLDRNDDGTIDSDEKTFVPGDTVKVNGREYALKIYPATGSCIEGGCMEFIYSGSRYIEVVNARTYFPGQDIGRFARMSYEQSYSLQDRKLVSAVIYWLGGRQNSFGGSSGTISTTAVGGVKNTVYMPYRVNLRWR